MVLLAVDIQQGITDDRLYAFDDFKTNVKRLIDEARCFGIEVIYIRHDDGEGSGFSAGDAAFEIASEFAPLEGEKIFDKKVNSCLDPAIGLLEYLKSKNVKDLIISGLQTDYCIDATVKSAFEHGFKVIVPKGCNSTRANAYMDAETTYKFYNDSMWPGRYAECISIEETISLMKAYTPGEKVSPKRILCFGDSLTWGYDPELRTRIDASFRWTGVLAKKLGDGYTVIEEGQNGRTIATDDPAEGEKNGIRYIVPCLESQSPLDVMVLMLGTNDLKRKFNYCAPDIACEMERLIQKITAHNMFKLQGKMKILLVAPPHVGEDIRDSWLGDSFGYERAVEVSRQLSPLYEDLAKRYNLAFLDASLYVEVCPADSIHLDAKAQTKLGEAIFSKLKEEQFI